VVRVVSRVEVVVVQQAVRPVVDGLCGPRVQQRQHEQPRPSHQRHAGEAGQPLVHRCRHEDVEDDVVVPAGTWSKAGSRQSRNLTLGPGTFLAPSWKLPGTFLAPSWRLL